MAADIRYVDSNGVKLAYCTHGSGSRNILLVLPWFSNLDILFEYEPVVRGLDALAEIGQLIMFDRRGTGLSDRLCAPATLEEGMDDILAVLAHAGVEQATVVGIHEAGPLCMLFAATHPECVRDLVLYGTFATTTWKPDYPWGQLPEDRDVQVRWVLDTWGTRDSAAALINPSAASDERFLAWAERWQRGSVSHDALQRFFEILAETDVTHVLPTLRVPTLILHRPANPAVPVENARYLRDHIPGAKLVEVPGEDYLPFLSDWQPIADEIEEFITGGRRKRESERVLATILFTDIVGSSRLAKEMGDARWRRLMDEVDEIVHRYLDRHEGRLVKTLGDGHLAVFDRPARAIHCACEIRRGVATLGVAMRFGLHTGEAEVRGDDLSGIALHIAARVMEAADGHDVLVSGAIPPLIAGSGIAFEDRGAHELRGIEGSWQLFAVA
ncbi:MAG: adenylate/guanylate cyclase domain-containing protein [Actinomycetota bacterium]|nr:adenylate/guanylate cyclase domain-containing protein [Actinomycetota bacterium]